MYPTISDLLFDFTGIYIPLPIQTFGFFVAMAFLAAAWTLSLELKRKEKEGLLSPIMEQPEVVKPASGMDYALSALIGFVLGFKVLFLILHYQQFVDDPQSVLLNAEGNLAGGFIGAMLAIYFKYRDNKTQLATPTQTAPIKVHPYQLVGNITMVAAAGGLLGAKIFHNLENIDDFFRDPWNSLISFMGLTMYGGLIVGGAAVIWYGNKKKIHWRHLIDAAAPGLMLSYGIGRIGCQMSGDGDWGINNTSPKPEWMSFLPDWTWAFNYPHNVISEGIAIAGCEGRHCYELAVPVFPTPLYEATVCIGLFFVLWGFRKKINIPGMMFSVYLIMNGMERFFIEKIRVNTLYHFGGYGITQAEIISVCLFLLGLYGIWYFNKNKNVLTPSTK